MWSGRQWFPFSLPGIPGDLGGTRSPGTHHKIMSMDCWTTIESPGIINVVAGIGQDGKD